MPTYLSQFLSLHERASLSMPLMIVGLVITVFFMGILWTALFPGLVMTRIVVGLSVLGEGLSELINPRWRS